MVTKAVSIPAITSLGKGLTKSWTRRHSSYKQPARVSKSGVSHHSSHHKDEHVNLWLAHTVRERLDISLYQGSSQF